MICYSDWLNAIVTFLGIFGLSFLIAIGWEKLKGGRKNGRRK